MSSTSIARADDAGIFSFFQHAFGGGGGGGDTQSLPQPDYVEPSAPPLTVRRHEPRHHHVAHVMTPQETLEAMKGVTIYTDKTLVRGDVVMTDKGLRIFNGSSAWPHTEDDFVAVADVKKLAPDMRKELDAIDEASRFAAND